LTIAYYSVKIPVCVLSHSTGREEENKGGSGVPVCNHILNPGHFQFTTILNFGGYI